MTQEPVERRTRGNALVRCGGRAGETDQKKLWNRAPARPYVFGRGMSPVATLVERSTRYLMLVGLLDGHRADLVPDALAAAITRLPRQLTRSLTWDQGHEMAAHARFTVDTGVAVYFCDPKNPWQRGSNENTNGLLRQYLPRHVSLRDYSQADLDDIAAELNGRPRQTLGFKTPSEALTEALR